MLTIICSPIHLAVGYPGVVDPIAMRTMINQFLDWAQARPNVWIVSNEQVSLYPALTPPILTS